VSLLWSDNIVGKESELSKTQNLHRNAYAVIIGIGNYRDARIPKLDYARADAQAFFDLLINPKRVGIRKDKIRLLIDQEATLFNIKDNISGWLFRNAGTESTVIIFFAGHGGLETDRKGLEKDGLAKYLLPWDAKPDNLYASSLSNNDFEGLLATIKSNRLAIFMDSCYAGGVSERKARDIQITDDPYQKLTTGSGRLVIAAAQPNQRAFEDHSLRHGIFAHHLLEALEGKADYDNDGYVTLVEVFKYLEKKVPETARQLAEGIQEPVLHGDLTKDITLSIVSEKLEKIRRTRELAEKEAEDKKRKEKLFQWYCEGKLSISQYNRALDTIKANYADLDEKDRRIVHLTESLLSGTLDIDNYTATLELMGVVEAGVAELDREVQGLRSRATKHIDDNDYAAARPILERILELNPDDYQTIRSLEMIRSELKTQEDAAALEMAPELEVPARAEPAPRPKIPVRYRAWRWVSGCVEKWGKVKHIRTVVILVAIGVAVYFILQWGGGWKVLTSSPQTWVNNLVHTVEGWFFR